MAHCQHFDVEFTPKTSRRQFCSDVCRKAHWTRQREDQKSDIRELAWRLALRVGLTAEDLR